MPHTRSAAKRLRQSDKRRKLNRNVLREVKTQLKKVKTVAAAASVDVNQLETEVRQAIKRVDRAAAKGVVHKNLAARKKSQLARLLFSKGKPAAAT